MSDHLTFKEGCHVLFEKQFFHGTDPTCNIKTLDTEVTSVPLTLIYTTAHCPYLVEALHKKWQCSMDLKRPSCMNVTCICCILAENVLDIYILDTYAHICNMWFRVMVFNATSNDISVISWQSVSLIGETGVPGENRRPAASHWQTLSHNVLLNTHCHERYSRSHL